jgi:hypothetical protein
MRTMRSYRSTLLLVCAFLVGLAVGIPLQFPIASAQDNPDSATQFRDTMLNASRGSHTLFMISPHPGENETRLWINWTTRSQAAGTPSLWFNVVVPNNETLVLTIGDDNARAWASVLPSNDESISANTLRNDWLNQSAQ